MRKWRENVILNGKKESNVSQKQKWVSIMKQTRPLDTSPETERVQIEILRKMSPARRLQLAIALTRSMCKRLESGVRLRHPDYDDWKVKMAVIRLTLPEELFLSAYPHAKEILP